VSSLNYGATQGANYRSNNLMFSISYRGFWGKPKPLQKGCLIDNWMEATGFNTSFFGWPKINVITISLFNIRPGC
jgi:hypothetical protein